MSKGELPLFARITVKGKRAEIALNKRVNPNQWNPKTGYLESGPEFKTINAFIDQVKAKLFKIYTKMQTLEEFISAEAIKLEYTGKKEEKKTLLQVFDYHNKQMEKVIDIDIVRPTWIKFNTIRTKVESFIKHQYKKSDFFLEELSHVFISNFEYYLKTEENIQHNTTMKYIQNLKKIIHLSVRNGWLQRDPFANFRCSFRKVNRNVLTESELKTIEEKVFSIPRLDTV